MYWFIVFLDFAAGDDTDPNRDPTELIGVVPLLLPFAIAGGLFIVMLTLRSLFVAYRWCDGLSYYWSQDQGFKWLTPEEAARSNERCGHKEKYVYHPVGPFSSKIKQNTPVPSESKLVVLKETEEEFMMRMNEIMEAPPTIIDFDFWAWARSYDPVLKEVEENTGIDLPRRTPASGHINHGSNPRCNCDLCYVPKSLYMQKYKS